MPTRHRRSVGSSQMDSVRAWGRPPTIRLLRQMTDRIPAKAQKLMRAGNFAEMPRTIVGTPEIS